MTTTLHTAQTLAASVPDVLITAERIAQTVMHGGHNKRMGGGGETFWQYHPYTQDQDTRRIDWRQSAKGDHVYVREEERQNAQTHLFWCAGGASMDFKSDAAPMTKFEAAQCLTLALSIIMTRRHERIGALNTGRAGYGYTMNAVHRLQESFAHEHHALPLVMQAVPKHAHTVLAGDFLMPINDIESAIKPLSGQTRSGTFIHVLDPAEMTLPYRGHVKFEGVSGALKTLIRSVGAIKDDYIKRMTAHCTALETLCTRHGWYYHRHVTDADMVQTLAHIIAKRGA